MDEVARDDDRMLAAWRNALPAVGEHVVRPTTLFIACGAMAKELVALKQATGWTELTITCLPAHWHNTPQNITPGVLRKLRSASGT